MILIIDDDIAIRTSLTYLLERAGYSTLAVSSPSEAIDVVRSTTPLLIIMDMNFSRTTSGIEGISLLKQVKLFVPNTPVILITAWGNISLAVEGMRAGAFDFVTKPWNNIALLNVVTTAMELSQTKKEKPTKNDFPKIIGQSKAIKDILSTVTRVARTKASVLITGESGTGKELIAEAIHDLSLRSDKPFVKVNLGGSIASLFESEMFGHKKGAFTDAYSDREGRFSLADKGTIFLDEIGDLDMSCQVKLLRVLQEQTFEVLGESRQRKIDVRVVSATNKNLRQMVAEGTFREDLLYRINLIPIHLPPLRERWEDIPLLVRYIADNAARNYNLPNPEISSEAMDYLQRLPYSGNIRELKNLIERTLIMAGDKTLERTDFEAQHRNTSLTDASAHELTLEEIEKQRIEEVLKESNYNISKTATMLGLSRAALYRRLEKYSIRLER
ncbi:MAG: sigma-54 dependent transcriptional regulator [Rikenellaceae bacterium]